MARFAEESRGRFEEVFGPASVAGSSEERQGVWRLLWWVILAPVPADLVEVIA